MPGNKRHDHPTESKQPSKRSRPSISEELQSASNLLNEINEFDEETIKDCTYQDYERMLEVSLLPDLSVIIERCNNVLKTLEKNPIDPEEQQEAAIDACLYLYEARGWSLEYLVATLSLFLDKGDKVMDLIKSKDSKYDLLRDALKQAIDIIFIKGTIKPKESFINYLSGIPFKLKDITYTRSQAAKIRAQVGREREVMYYHTNYMRVLADFCYIFTPLNGTESQDDPLNFGQYTAPLYKLFKQMNLKATQQGKPCHAETDVIDQRIQRLENHYGQGSSAVQEQSANNEGNSITPTARLKRAQKGPRRQGNHEQPSEEKNSSGSSLSARVSNGGKAPRGGKRPRGFSVPAATPTTTTKKRKVVDGRGRIIGNSPISIFNTNSSKAQSSNNHPSEKDTTTPQPEM